MMEEAIKKHLSTANMFNEKEFRVFFAELISMSPEAQITAKTGSCWEKEALVGGAAMAWGMVGKDWMKSRHEGRM